MATFWAREDSPSANNAELNPVGINGANGFPAIQITFVPDPAAGTDGDIIIENGALDTGPIADIRDPDTLVQIGSTTYQFDFVIAGNVPTGVSNQYDINGVDFRGDRVIIIEVYDYPALGETTRLFFFPDTTYTNVELNQFPNGALNINSNGEGNTDPQPICFTEGMMIRTPDGLRPVEDIAAGDVVIDRDGTLQRVVWTGARRVSRQELETSPHLRPVRIAASAFGPGCPSRDIAFSQQHRLVLKSATLDLLFGGSEALAPALWFVGHPGVSVDESAAGVTYVHILCEAHCVLTSEGIESETMLAGPMALRSVGSDARRELETLFPALAEHEGPSPVRACLPVLRRHEFDCVLAMEKGVAACAA